MILRPSLTPFALGLFASLLAIACAPEPAQGDGADGMGSTEDEMRGSCTNPRRYFVVLDHGACEEIAGQRGRWVPEPLFADAPADVQASTCTYQWVGDKWSRPDRNAILTKIGLANGLAPACGSASSPDTGALDEIPHVDPGKGVGAAGCDVCGIVLNNHLWVVLPDQTVTSRQFQVQLSNGGSRSFHIGGSGANAMSIALPPPPPGASYLAGRVHID